MPMTRVCDGAVLGYLSFARALRTPRKAGDRVSLDLWIDHVYVLPAHRGRGHGAALGAALLGVISDDLGGFRREPDAPPVDIAIHADFVSEGGAAIVTRIVERLACPEWPCPKLRGIANATLVGGW
jgi:GNAT superfamily N-acetyltransferase